MDFTIKTVVKEPVRTFNPYFPEGEGDYWGDMHYIVLCHAFVSAQKAFVVDIREFIEAAKSSTRPVSEDNVREGFEFLVKIGFLTKEGDFYTPTNRFLDCLFS